MLALVAARVLLGLALALWAVIALFDSNLAGWRAGFAAGALLALFAIIGLARGWPGASIAGAAALLGPIGLLAHANGASPWAWLFWIACAAATERWLRDADGERRLR